jgi:UDP-N-acetylmuramate dehydrogenase
MADIRGAILNIRRGKFPDLCVEGSAGSYFKNPMLSRGAAEKLQKQYPGMPLFDMPETTQVKVPLAWLLDKVLHLNGYRIGSVRLFEGQPIVIVADRGSTAVNVRVFAACIREYVRNKFGLEIEEEVRIIG